MKNEILKNNPDCKELKKAQYIGIDTPHDCENNANNHLDTHGVVSGFLVHPEGNKQVFCPHVFNINDKNEVVEYTKLEGIEFKDCIYIGNTENPKEKKRLKFFNIF